MSKFAHIICKKCFHKNFFTRLTECPNCDEPYSDECPRCSDSGIIHFQHGCMPGVIWPIYCHCDARIKAEEDWQKNKKRPAVKAGQFFAGNKKRSD